MEEHLGESRKKSKQEIMDESLLGFMKMLLEQNSAGIPGRTVGQIPAGMYKRISASIIE